MGWEDLVGEYAGFVVTADNRLALDLWASSEGMPAWENNWLATTLDGYGGTAVNGVGVKAYPTEDAGARATAGTLVLGYYTAVLNAFKQDAGLAALYIAINASPWCGGCQGGSYPIALHDYLSGGGNISPSNPPAPSAPPAQPNPQDGGTASIAWENMRAFVRQDAPALASALLSVQQSVDGLWN